MHTILTLAAEERLAIQRAARDSVADRFSEAAFERDFVKHIAPLLPK